MNKGKENYQNIPLPDGLSDAVRKGIKKGKRHMEKKWIAAAVPSPQPACWASSFLTHFPRTAFAPPQKTIRPPRPAWQISERPDAGGGRIRPSRRCFRRFCRPGFHDDTSEADPSMEGPAAEQTAPSSLRVTGIIAEISDDQILLKNEEEGAAYPRSF